MLPTWRKPHKQSIRWKEATSYLSRKNGVVWLSGGRSWEKSGKSPHASGGQSTKSLPSISPSILKDVIDDVDEVINSCIRRWDTYSPPSLSPDRLLVYSQYTEAEGRYCQVFFFMVESHNLVCIAHCFFLLQGITSKVDPPFSVCVYERGDK